MSPLLIPGVINSHQSPGRLQVDVSREALKTGENAAWWIEFLVYLTISATFSWGASVSGMS